jgi:RHS repeat-associated protein
VLPTQLSEAEFAQQFKPSWALSLLWWHPEYRRLKQMEPLRQSDIFDNQMQKTETYAEARALRYLNPTNNFRAPFSQFSPFMFGRPVDPFYTFAPGNAYRGFVENKMLRFQRLSGFNYTTIWSTATIAAVCKQNETACFNAYSQTRNAFSSALCEADLNQSWIMFRNLYLSIKQQVKQQILKGAPSGAVPAGKIPRFASPMDALASQSNYISTHDPATVRRAYDDSVRTMYSDNCKAYATLWIQQLGTCQFNWAADSAKIIGDLVNVCSQASDPQHPMGASNIPSTANPVAPNRFRSFDEVINFYRRPGASPLDCNGYLITVPAAYEKPKPVADQPLMQPDPCVCNNVNQYYRMYQAGAKGRTFAQYLAQEWNIRISEENANNLRQSCTLGPNGSCRNLLKPLVVPPALQCNGVKPCATCQDIQQLYQQFTNTFGSVALSYNEDDLVQQRHNQLFANFMNRNLGFSKTAMEYLQFMDSCRLHYTGETNRDSTALADLLNQSIDPAVAAAFGQVSCDSLNAVLRGFQAAYNSTTPCSDGLQFDGVNSMATIPEKNGKLNFGQGDFTMEVFFKTPKGQSSSVILSKRTTLNPPGGGSYPGPRFNADGFLLGMFYGSTPFIQLAGTPNWVPLGPMGIDLTDGNYHQLAITRHADTVSIFADGRRAGGPNKTYTFRDVSTNGPLYIGYDVIDQSHFAGTIRELRFWNLVRPDTALQSNLAANVGGQPGLVGYYRMKDAAGSQVVTDETAVCPGDRNDIILGRTLAVEPQDPVWVPGGACAKSGCKAAFLRYFNNNFNTCLTEAQARLIYFYKCHQLPNPCGDVPPSCDSLQRIFKAWSATGAANCDTAGFTRFFNQRTGVTYSFLDIAMLYMTSCGSLPSLCPPPPPVPGQKLCGAVTPFTADQSVPDDACGTAADLVAMKSTEDYNLYHSNLLGNFEETYLATCLNAFQIEDFSVTYQLSEYHYTLYYYDQAGNLIKTIPPQGVDQSRMGDEAWLQRVAAARTAGIYDPGLVPAHGLATQYSYNTLGHVSNQHTPDGGTSRFWYDRLGRLAVSQNAKQLPQNQYSYTVYDYLGRITEVGQTVNGTGAGMNGGLSRNPPALSGWLNQNQGRNEQITQTVYDIAYQPLIAAGVLQQANLRNRVSYSRLIDKYSTDATQYSSGTFYSYDIHGNVDQLLQDYKGGVMNDAYGNRFKKVQYQYDLISGKVNRVDYQPGQKDQFAHRYEYDAENRITDVYTSRDGLVWEHEAFYQYYKHGPLAREVIGEQQVQGLDYAYTLQGWLKGVNSTALDPQLDMGGDGLGGGQNQYVARDAFGFALHYYDRNNGGGRSRMAAGLDYGYQDYVSIAGAPFAAIPATMIRSREFKPLFNGNIAAMAVNIGKFNNPVLYNYGYDQLNRLKQLDAYSGLNSISNTWDAGFGKMPDYHEEVSYDANGNILGYRRDGFGSNLAMDNLSYSYNRDATGRLLNNRLRSVQDGVTNSPASYNDIKSGQIADNYTYDEIGNLTGDDQEGITGVQWTVYGKIAGIVKRDGTKISYSYDAGGHRISKTVNGQTTWYARDASGNVMGVYVVGDPATNGGHMSLSELDIYGSSRLGMLRADQDLTVTASGRTPIASLNSSYGFSTFMRGKKFFELTNHLGNVLVTVTDKKQQHSTDGVHVDYFMADVASANDYYPFGMQMPGRSYIADGSLNYRYGFNGKENDNEVKGVGNQIDYGMRVYDPRIGKFLSVDPLAKKYPGLTPYQFSSNRPIDGIDQDGGEWKKVSTYDPKTGVTNIQFQVKLSLVNDSKVFNDIKELIPELQRQIESSFEAANTDKIHYSAKIDVTADKDPGRYSAILYDRQKGNLIAGIESGPPNTQDNAVSVAAANNVDPATPGSGNSRDIKLIAQDIIHELLHTANVKHPHDPDNNAEDVDVKPVFKTAPNGQKVFDTYVPGVNANLALIIHNIMIYGDVLVNGKKVKQHEPDPTKRGEISPDQAKIVTQQVDLDTKKKQ